MRIAWPTALACLAAAAAASGAGAAEVNAWPAAVFEEDDSGRTLSWSGAGPFLFSEPAPQPDAGTFSGLRPFWVEMDSGGVERTDILYPLFYTRRYGDVTKWSFFHLVNGEDPGAGAAGLAGSPERHLDVWPFYFSLESPDPSESYHALLPLYGTVRQRLGFKRISWVAFPIYAQTERKGSETTYFAWPIVRSVQGSEHGFEVWPLFGATSGPGGSRHAFFAWPLFWDNTIAPGPDAPGGGKPSTQLGILPFYTRETAPGSVSENFLWPFFGYTEATAPARYSERRYFWPFLVQGRGDARLVERWGPFYTHSQSMGVASTWVMWPLWHRTRWADGDIGQQKTQFFYFLYSSLDQTSESRPGLQPAYKRHIWPLVSIWDNGAGSRQVQFPSPLEVFFPDNPDMRATWSPFFSLYRYDRRPDGGARSSMLWNAVTWRRGASGGLEEFHLGPLLGMCRDARGPRWSLLGFDFGPNRNMVEGPRK
jgi:hypothetical protein